MKPLRTQRNREDARKAVGECWCAALAIEYYGDGDLAERIKEFAVQLREHVDSADRDAS